MGSDAHYPEEAPAPRASPSTASGSTATRSPTAGFAAFAAETGYVTVAERPLDPAGVPGRARRRTSCPARWCSRARRGPVDLRHINQWWAWTPGACWRRPEGPGSALAGREEHPVVHVAYEDAARLRRRGRAAALPTEAEWELAARGGLDGARLRLGRRARAAGRAARQLLARRLPVARRSPATGRPRRSARSRPTASGCSTWPATSGSGRRTGTAAARRRASTRPSRSSRSRARSSRAARSCAPTATACATAPPRAARR